MVLCGPTDLILQKPVVLSIQHCASMRQGGWKLSVCSSRTPLEEPPKWQVGYTLNRGSHMSTHILLNLLNKLGKSVKMLGLPSIFNAFSQQV